MLKISTAFDGGSILVHKLSDPADIRVGIKPDNASDFKQWFYFRLQGAAHQPCKISFGDVSDTAFPDFTDYHVFASYDRQNWFRVHTYFENNELWFEHTPLSNSVYYAYFEPYTWDQHLNLIGDAQGSGLVQVEDLGSTLQGRDMNLLIIGNQAASDKKIWVIARQHPGETMAEWFVEGLLGRLLDGHDALARTLLDECTFYVVPNMNPDGAVLGNQRTNFAGANLNREWLNPSMEKSPEVYLVREKMHEIGVDMCLDIHGDENIPYVFVAGTEGVPTYNARIAGLEAAFKTAYAAANPDFQDEFGYDKDAPGQADLRFATNYVGHTFQCLAYTIEMPYKDNHNIPDDDFGWNAQRSLRLGESALNAIGAVYRDLR